jgi:UDP-3-O-[3-hydroxymyristoyl] glucosamine N-acyltransferase
MSVLLQTIRELVHGELTGEHDAVISGVSALEDARPGELTFAEHDRYAPQVRLTHAAAVIVSPHFPVVSGKTLLRVPNPRIAFVQVMRLFQPRRSASSGIHPAAVIAPQAIVEPNVTIGPCAVVEPGARLGRGTVVEAGTYVGSAVTIGQDCYLGPNVVLMDRTQLGHRVAIHGGSVIGGDGFGYVWDGTGHLKVPQLGHVIIEDDVEIGCNVCVDRATMGSTIIRRGTKIDNLVQIAHNNRIGEHVIITGQGGLSGSVTVGSYAVLGGRTGVSDHVSIGEGAHIGIASIITKSVAPGETVWGYPARAARRVKRELASLAQLPRLLKEFNALQTRVAEMAAHLKSGESTSSH